MYRALIFAIIAISCLLLFKVQWQNPLKVPIVQKLKIMDITNETQTQKVIFPAARRYTLILGMPLEQSKKIKGTLSIDWRGSNLVFLDLERLILTEDRQLRSGDLKSYMICNLHEANSNFLNNGFKGKSEYQFTVSNSIPGTSIWLMHTHPSGDE